MSFLVYLNFRRKFPIREETEDEEPAEEPAKLPEFENIQLKMEPVIKGPEIVEPVWVEKKAKNSKKEKKNKKEKKRKRDRSSSDDQKRRR